MKKVLFFLFSLLWTLYFLSHLLLTSDMLYLGDAYLYCYPKIQYMVSTLKSGFFPFWNPYLQGGVPYFSDPTNGVFYLPHVIFFLFSFPWAIKIFLLFHYLMAFWGAYFCARVQRISEEGSLISAMAFGFCGYLICFANGLIKLKALVWVPWIFALWRRAIKNNSYKDALGGGLALAMVLFAGHLYLAYFCCVFLTIDWFFFHKRNRRKILGFLTMIIAVGIGLSACQWIPVYPLKGDSIRRQKLEDYELFKWSMPPGKVLDFGVPGARGLGKFEDLMREGAQYPMVGSIYFGLLTVLLAILARKREGTFWWFLLMVSFFLALGNHTFFYPLIQKIFPFLSTFRYPEKFIFWSIFSMAILAGSGYDRFFKRKSPFDGRKVLVFLVTVGAATWIFQTPPEGDLANRSLSGWAFLRTLGFLILFGLLFYFRHRTAMAGVILIALIGSDLRAINARQIPTIPQKFYFKRPTSLLYLPPPSVSSYRFCRYPYEVPIGRATIRENFIQSIYDHGKESLFHNTPFLYGYPTLHGMCTLRLWRHQTLVEALDSKKEELLGLFNVRFLMVHIDNSSFEKAGWNLVQKFPDGEFKLLENSHFQPRVRLVKKALFVQDSQEALGALSLVNLKDQVVIERADSSGKSLVSTSHPSDYARIVQYETNRVVVEVKSASRGYLILSDSMASGWKAFREGKEVPLYYSNFLFRGVEVKKGKQTIVFSYVPPGWYLGWSITLLTLLALLALAWWRRKFFSRKNFVREQREPGESDIG